MSKTNLPMFSSTENGAVAYATTMSSIMDLFVKTVRNCIWNTNMVNLMKKTWNENPELFLKLIYFTRDPRHGKGERDVSYKMVSFLKSHLPLTYKLNIRKIAVDFGRIKDLIKFAGIPTGKTEIQEDYEMRIFADILLQDDISKLFDMADDKYSVMVAKNKHKFEWASVMLFNCAKCQKLVPQYIEDAESLHTIAWIEDKEKIGELPSRWNHLVGYDEPNNDVSLIHYTQGIPAFEETKDCEHAAKWYAEHQMMNSATTWKELMGNSVHAAKVDGILMPKYKAERLVNEKQSACS